MTIKALKTIYVTAIDVATCATFYQQAFNLEIQFADADRWTQFRLNGLAFAVACPEEAAQGAVGATMVLEATDDADHDRVVAAGATLIGERDMGTHGRTRSYRDPAGNVVQLFWKK